ncbi:MAG: pilin N-terminal domain-containing protein, partial [Anaerococcus vaginalis]
MKKRFLSLIIALAMMVGVFTPLLTSAADGKTETVTLHKLMMDKATLDAWDFNQVEKDGYNGTQNLDQLKALNSLAGKDIKEIPNVYFALKFAADYKDATKAGKYVKADAADKLKPVEPLEATDNIDEAVGGLTTPNGVVFKTSALEGNFEMDEIHEKSTYKGENGETLTDMKAVPVKITLPLVNDKGVVPNAHVYPKNTEEKPDTHKDFTKEFTTEQPNGRTDEQKNEAAAEPHNVGDVIDYTVTTKVPAKTKWKTAFWDDKMTEGLTFIQRKDNADKGITVKYDGNVMDASWYELDETENGFTLKLTDTGLSEIAKATEVKEIRLDYHATVNEKAVVAIPESNDVSFHYGNHKDHGTTPVPNKPNDNGELTVTKNWDTGVAKKDVEFTLYNAQTGKIVEAKDVEAVKGYEFKNPVTIPAGDTMSYTWKGLNKNIEYKVEEKYNEYSAEYKKGDAGQITVKNYNDENPKPINPTEPKVVTYGAKFVKT